MRAYSWRRALGFLPLGLALLLFAGLDLLRAYAGPALDPALWGAGLLALAVLASTLSRAEGGLRRHAAVLLLFACLLPVYVHHPRHLESDGVHYFIWLRSALFDGDVDHANDFPLFGSDYAKPNVLPVGAPLLWAPLVVPLHVGRMAGSLLGYGRPSGTEPLYQAAPALATLAWASAGLVLLLLTLRDLFGARAAFWTVLLCWLATPLRFYLSVLPSLAHGCEFFAAVLVLRAWLALRRGPTTRRAVLAGAACGLVFLVRSQDGLLLMLPGLELIGRLLRGPDRRTPLRLGILMGGAFLAAALPQLVVWQLQFGRPVVIPHEVLHGDAFLRQQEPQLLGALVSERGGVLTSYPVLLVALLGLLVRARRDARGVGLILLALAATWWLNASLFDWYHVRRYTGVVPFLSLGLATVVAPLARHGVVLALVTLLAWRYDLAVDALRAQAGQPAPVRAVVARVADDAAASTYALLERAAPRVAVEVLAAYTGNALRPPVAQVELGEDPWVLRLPRPARNLSAPAAEDGRVARWITDEDARLYLPLAVAQAGVLTLHARVLETVEPQALRVAWNGVPLGELPARAGWAAYRFDVPASAMRVGTNEVVVSFARAPLYRRIRGEGPRGVRPAALSALELHVQPN
jgi:hypothetical protein